MVSSRSGSLTRVLRSSEYTGDQGGANACPTSIARISKILAIELPSAGTGRSKGSLKSGILGGGRDRFAGAWCQISRAGARGRKGDRNNGEYSVHKERKVHRAGGGLGVTSSSCRTLKGWQVMIVLTGVCDFARVCVPTATSESDANHKRFADSPPHHGLLD